MTDSTFVFSGDQLDAALAQSELPAHERVAVRDFLNSDAARKLRVQPSRPTELVEIPARTVLGIERERGRG
jgi:hypothetical protein